MGKSVSQSWLGNKEVLGYVTGINGLAVSALTEKVKEKWKNSVKLENHTLFNFDKEISVLNNNQIPSVFFLMVFS